MKDEKRTSLISPALLRLIIAFAAAVLLWFYINGSSGNLVTKNISDIPVSIVGEDELAEKGLYAETYGSEYFVSLQLRGTDANLKNVNSTTFTATVDVSQIDSEGTYTLDVVLQGLPNSIILNDMNPGTISLAVGEYTERQMDIDLITNGKPADGHTFKEAEAYTQVKIRGLSTDLGRIKKVEGIVSISGLSESSSQMVTPVAYDSDGNVVTDVVFEPEQVWVSITIN